MFFVSWTLPDVLNLIASGGTAILASVAVWQGFQTRAQIKLSEKQLDSAKTSADAAVSSAATAAEVQRESVRSRIDQLAPVVVAHYGAPQGPLLDSQRTGMPQASGLRLLDQQSFDRSRDARSQKFVFPQDERSFLWFHGTATLINEGSTTARVRLTKEAKFIDGTSNVDGSRVPLPMPASDGSTTEALLPPAGQAVFLWAEGHAVGEWAKATREVDPPSPYGSIWLWVESFDVRESGVIDTNMAHFHPSVISPSRGEAGIWEVNESSEFGAIYPQPIRRGYRTEGAAHSDLSQMYDYFGLDKTGRAIEGDLPESE